MYAEAEMVYWFLKFIYHQWQLMTAAYSCCCRGYKVHLLADFSLNFFKWLEWEIFSVLRNPLDISTNKMPASGLKFLWKSYGERSSWFTWLPVIRKQLLHACSFTSMFFSFLHSVIWLHTICVQNTIIFLKQARMETNLPMALSMCFQFQTCFLHMVFHM